MDYGQSENDRSNINLNESDSMKGDYKILCESIEKKREEVRRTRFGLGMDLHRLGEHHVRKREYSEAVSAFSEALTEKRSAANLCFETDERRDCIDQRNESHQSSEQRSINEVISTLSSLGTIHSLVGEHSEAMRCYSEITTMRSSLSLPLRQENSNQAPSPCWEL